MGVIFTIIEAICSAYGWVKNKTSDLLGRSEQTNDDLEKQNQSLERQLGDAVDAIPAADKLRDKSF
jgi:hypothetical protein